MLKIYLSPSNQPANKYCVGSTNEKEQMEEVARKIKAILNTEYDCEVVIATFYLDIELNGRALEAKNKNCDVYIAIHSNAGGGGSASGAVAFYHPSSEKGKLLALNVVEELNLICPVKSNRLISVENGMKAFNGIGYGEIRNPSSFGMISVLVETNFHDNTKTAQWIIDKKDEIARAYVNAIVKTFSISKKSDESSILNKKYYRVQVGAFAKKDNANVLIDKLKKAGFEGYIKYD